MQEPAPIEDLALDALLNRPLGDRRADRFGPFQVAAAHVLGESALQRRFDARSRDERLAAQIVDDLGINVRHAAEHGEPRPLRRTADALPLPELNSVAAIA